MEDPPPKGDGAAAFEAPPNGVGAAPKRVDADEAPIEPKGEGVDPNGVVEDPPKVFAPEASEPIAPNPEDTPNVEPVDGAAVSKGVLCVDGSAAIPSAPVPKIDVDTGPKGLEEGAPPKGEAVEVVDVPKG